MQFQSLNFLTLAKHHYFDMFLTLLEYTAYSRQFSIQSSQQYSLQNLKLVINIHVSFFLFHKSTQEAQTCIEHQLKEKEFTFIQIWMKFYRKISTLKIRKYAFSQQKLQNYVFKYYDARICIHLKAY